jgi:site-specific DNA-methyltransferase (adenine-specific)
MAIELLNIDCMEFMKTCNDNEFDLAICDPPYGIGFDGHDTITKEGHKGFTRSNKLYEKKNWDSATPTQEYFTELQRVSKNQIIWGGNYFTDKLPVSRGWIFWDKKITNAKNFTFSDGELAWTSFDKILKKITYDWIGFGYLNNSRGQKKTHPTEKPIDLYRHVLREYATKGDKILDTHLGSGSIAIACHEEGFDLVGCEIDNDYFNNAKKRLTNETNQTILF